MSEEDGTTVADPQAGADDQPQVGTPDASQVDATKPSSKQVTISEADLRALKNENQNLRRRTKEIDDAKLSESERIQAENAALAKQRDSFKSGYSALLVEKAANKLGFADSEVAYKLIKDDLAFDDDGKPTNADDLLQALLKKSPYLRADQPAAQPPKPGISPAGGNRAAGGTTPASTDLRNMPRLGDRGIWKTGPNGTTNNPS